MEAFMRECDNVKEVYWLHKIKSNSRMCSHAKVFVVR